MRQLAAERARSGSRPARRASSRWPTRAPPSGRGGRRGAWRAAGCRRWRACRGRPGCGTAAAAARWPRATATTKAVRWCQVTFDVEDRRRAAREEAAAPRCTSCGLHSHCPSPSRATRRLTVTTIRTVSGTSCSPRMIPRSISQPEQRARATRSTPARASGHGPAPVDVQLPVRERAEHPDGAVGEVEDARGGVGEHQAARRQGEDRRRWHSPRIVLLRKSSIAASARSGSGRARRSRPSARRRSPGRS